jgi:hypothetical protein
LEQAKDDRRVGYRRFASDRENENGADSSDGRLWLRFWSEIGQKVGKSETAAKDSAKRMRSDGMEAHALKDAREKVVELGRNKIRIGPARIEERLENGVERVIGDRGNLALFKQQPDCDELLAVVKKPIMEEHRQSVKCGDAIGEIECLREALGEIAQAIFVVIEQCDQLLGKTWAEHRSHKFKMKTIRIGEQ